MERRRFMLRRIEQWHNFEKITDAQRAEMEAELRTHEVPEREPLLLPAVAGVLALWYRLGTEVGLAFDVEADALAGGRVSNRQPQVYVARREWFADHGFTEVDRDTYGRLFAVLDSEWRRILGEMVSKSDKK